MRPHEQITQPTPKVFHRRTHSHQAHCVNPLVASPQKKGPRAPPLALQLHAQLVRGKPHFRASAIPNSAGSKKKAYHTFCAVPSVVPGGLSGFGVREIASNAAHLYVLCGVELTHAKLLRLWRKHRLTWREGVAQSVFYALHCERLAAVTWLAYGVWLCIGFCVKWQTFWLHPLETVHCVRRQPWLETITVPCTVGSAEESLVFETRRL